MSGIAERLRRGSQRQSRREGSRSCNFKLKHRIPLSLFFSTFGTLVPSLRVRARARRAANNFVCFLSDDYDVSCHCREPSRRAESREPTMLSPRWVSFGWRVRPILRSTTTPAIVVGAYSSTFCLLSRAIDFKIRDPYAHARFRGATVSDRTGQQYQHTPELGLRGKY